MVTVDHTGSGLTAGRSNLAITDVPFDLVAEGTFAVPAPSWGYTVTRLHGTAVAGASALIGDLPVAGIRPADLGFRNDIVMGIIAMITYWTDPRICADSQHLARLLTAVWAGLRLFALQPSEGTQRTAWHGRLLCTKLRRRVRHLRRELLRAAEKVPGGESARRRRMRRGAPRPDDGR